MRGQRSLVERPEGQRELDPITIRFVQDTRGQLTAWTPRVEAQRVAPVSLAYLVTATLEDPQNQCLIWAFCGRLALENGMREILLQPQTRMQFEQQVAQFIRGDLLVKAGINPMSPAQVEILQAEFRGTEYIATYQPR